MWHCWKCLSFQFLRILWYICAHIYSQISTSPWYLVIYTTRQNLYIPILFTSQMIYLQNNSFRLVPHNSRFHRHSRYSLYQHFKTSLRFFYIIFNRFLFPIYFQIQSWCPTLPGPCAHIQSNRIYQLSNICLAQNLGITVYDSVYTLENCCFSKTTSLEKIYYW